MFLGVKEKENYPELEVCVSTYAEVDSYQKAKYWQDMGADEITLLDTRVNRDFDLLADIRKRVTLKLRLIANTGCLLHCPFFQYHALLSTHGSQTAYSRKAGFAVDYCAIYCKYLRLLNPVNFIHSQWIRPEDLGIYEKLGIDGIKLIDRRCSTDLLVKITKTYAERKYDGNLLDLLPAFQGKSAKNLGNFLLKLRYFFHPFESDILGIIKLNKVIKKLDVYIDNARLDGFVSTLKDKDCRNKSCPECGYCAQIASAAIRFDQASLDEMLKTYAEAIKVMVKGKYGSY